jgi:hypothetical protein
LSFTSHFQSISLKAICRPKVGPYAKPKTGVDTVAENFDMQRHV